MIDSSEILDQINKKNVGGSVFDLVSYSGVLVIIFQEEPKLACKRTGFVALRVSPTCGEIGRLESREGREKVAYVCVFTCIPHSTV